MSDLSFFESRTGKVSVIPEKVFTFVTDLRNFKRFIPSGSVSGWNADRDSCSFNVPMAGTVNLRIIQREKFNRVVYKGDALKKEDFELVLDINGSKDNAAGVKVSATADLNPMMKMMASKPIVQFLEILIREMENFRNWDDVKE